MNELETQLSQIKKFQFVHERLFTSGQPTADELKLIKEYGIGTVINLAESDAEHALPHEDKVCLDIGLNYIQLPISLETPSSDQCLLFLDLLDHLLESQMVWVHCSNNNHASRDRKSTRLNSSHDQTSYAVFCLKKKKQAQLVFLFHFYCRYRRRSRFTLS